MSHDRCTTHRSIRPRRSDLGTDQHRLCPLLQEEATQEHEVAEALFDLANMFAAAEPVLEAEEAATASPHAGRSNTGGGHRAKRARNAKSRVAAEPVNTYPSRASARSHGAHNNAHNAASGFQVCFLVAALPGRRHCAFITRCVSFHPFNFHQALTRTLSVQTV